MGKDLSGKQLGKGITQRPDGRYEARAMIAGRKIDIYDKSLSSLKKRFENEKAVVLRDEKGIRPDLILRDWYKEWFEKCKSPQLKTDLSRAAYNRKCSNTFVRILGDKRVEDITQLNVQMAANQLHEETYSEKVIREGVGVLRECFDAAIANRILTVNPVFNVGISDGNVIAKERRVLTHWEQDAFIEEVEDGYYREPYNILLLTGMRIGELSGLQWDDVDFVKKRVHIRRSMATGYYDGVKVLQLTTPKTANSYRDIPFFGNVEEMFSDWREKQNTYRMKLGARWRCKSEFGDLVFTTTFGSPITRYNIVHDLKRVEKNICLKEAASAAREGREPREFGHLHPHAFRHTFATRCFERGLNPVTVQKIMGHADYATTLSYTHILDDMLDEAVRIAGPLI